MNGIFTYILAMNPHRIFLINKTGAPSVKGEVVSPHRTVDMAVRKIVINEPDPIGVFMESGIPDGEYAPIQVAGVADVYFVGDAVRGHIGRGFVTGEANYVAGQFISEAVPSSPFASDKHFYEGCHILENHTGAGIAKCNLHFN